MKTIGDALKKTFEAGKLIGGLHVKQMWDVSTAPDGREVRLLNYGIIGYAVAHATDLVKYEPFFDTPESYERDVAHIAQIVRDMRRDGLRFSHFPAEVKALLYRRARQRMRRLAFNNPPPSEKEGEVKIDHDALKEKYESQLAKKNEERRKTTLKEEQEREAEWMPPPEEMVG